MSAYNNNDTYGTSGTTGGLGSNTSGTNTYGSSTGGSDTYGSRPDNNTAGPHKSDLLNKADPRVDSDNSKLHDANRNTTSGYGSSNTGGLGSSNSTSSGYGSTNAGPHSSNIANSADPRVDSDLDRSRGLGSSTTGGLSSNTGYGSTGTTGLGSSTGHPTSGPHSTDTGNRVDPRVDDRYGSSTTDGIGSTTGSSGAYGSSTGTSGLGSSAGHSSGAHGSSNAGPHSSNLANKADPRVDSDFDRTRGPDSNAHTGYGGAATSNTSSGLGSTGTTGTSSGLGSSGAYGSSNTTSGLGSTGTSGAYGSTNAGPHSSNGMSSNTLIHALAQQNELCTGFFSSLFRDCVTIHNPSANKADPRVDSDLDSSRNTHGSSNLGSSTTTTGAAYGGSGVGSDNAYGSSNANTHADTKEGKNDSTMGKLMEKAGNMLNKEDLAAKGTAKRAEAAKPDGTY